MKLPHLISFQQIGKPEEGFLSVGSNRVLPFEIKRVFWTYDTPTHVIRGNHAHLHTEMILIAISGEIIVDCELKPNFKKSFTLNDPNIGLYIPVMCWHTMNYVGNAVQLVIANSNYDERDYIRSYDDYRNR